MPETPCFDKATPAWTLPWDADWVTAVAFPAKRRVAAGNNRGDILVWNLPDKPGAPPPLPQRLLRGHTNTVTRLIATKDGRWLLSSSYDHTIRCWDLQAASKSTAALVLNCQAREEAVRRRYGKVPPAIEAKVQVQEAAAVWTTHREWISGLSASKDDRWVLSGDDAGQVVLQERSSGKEVRRWQVHGWAHALALAPDGKRAVVAERLPLVFDSGRHFGVKLYEVETGKVVVDLSKGFAEMDIAAAAFSLDGKVLALGRGGEVYGPAGKVYLLDADSGKKLRELNPGHEAGATDLAFHPDGKHLASAGRDTQVRIWNVADGKLVATLGKPRGGQFKDWIHAVTFSPDGRSLAAADMAGRVVVWSFAG